MHRDSKRIPSEILVECGLEAMHQALKIVDTFLDNEYESTLEEISTAKIDNTTRQIDMLAEQTAMGILYASVSRAKYPHCLKVFGEESLGKPENKNINFTDEVRTVALLDMIDGTDLVYRGLPGWCSAMIFFFPPEKKILASVVGVPYRHSEQSHSYIAYCATPDQEPYTVPLMSKGQLSRAHRKRYIVAPKKDVALDNAGIAFYGQKAKNLLTIFGSMLPDQSDKITNLGHSRLGKYLLDVESSKPKLRIYNLGGNPIMLKVATGQMDAVFEIEGQKAHDVVPGAYIAKRAKSVVKGLDGSDLDLEDALMFPNNNTLKYIITASETLYEELRAHLADEIKTLG
jgi:fructose-1,6-bisphosphatase/inositol monophosphatase family enzyme